jgi:hypothetical protein
VRRFDDEYLEVARRDRDEWKSQYILKEVARDPAEFAERCHYHQHSPEFHCAKGKVCSVDDPQRQEDVE